MTVSKLEYTNRIYALWAEEIDLPIQKIRSGGNHLITLDDLSGTQMIQLFKIDDFSYIKCDETLLDILEPMMKGLEQGLSGKSLQTQLPDIAIEYDHIERVFYLYPDDFRPARSVSLPIRQLSEADQNDLEVLKAACTQEEFEDSWVNTADELAFGVYDGTALIACASMYKIWGFADPGILVHPDYRKQGLGRALISKISERCLQKGYVMNYRCTIDNLASANLAISLGFEQYFEIEVFKLNAN